MSGTRKCNTLVYGAGEKGCDFVYGSLKRNDEKIVAVSDINSQLWGKRFFGKEIIPPSSISNYEFDRIVVTMADWNAKMQAFLMLIDMGINRERIELQPLLDIAQRDLLTEPERIEFGGERLDFVRKMNELMFLRVEGSVAEAGVNRGDFACRLNTIFHDRKCYLFDTFEGFAEQDLIAEERIDINSSEHIRDSNNRGGFETSVGLVMSKMPYPENVIVKKGWIPDTLGGGIDDMFCFVSLDMDLYAPMLAAMRFFYSRMNFGGMMLLHDYYNPILHGVKKAVLDFENETGPLVKAPSFDKCSLAIIRI
ncbi:MAG: TylF/MycF family methyltransferase [Clostridiales Family XIII bacterium]|jgi:hypothetical protein|nr:TylF/MycF family methyltransferase [Clostridiales Family XIII bacterium]